MSNNYCADWSNSIPNKHQQVLKKKHTIPVDFEIGGNNETPK